MTGSRYVTPASDVRFPTSDFEPQPNHRAKTDVRLAALALFTASRIAGAPHRRTPAARPRRRRCVPPRPRRRLPRSSCWSRSATGSGMKYFTEPSFALPMRMPRFQARVAPAADGLRLRIRDVDVVLRVDEDSARAAELVPGVEQLAVLVEDLDAVVAAVADEQAALGIHRQRVRLVEVVGAVAELAPRFDQRSVLRKLVYSRRAPRGRRVALGDEDVAVGRDEDRVRLEEVVRVACAARLAERAQQLAVGAELEDLMSLGRSGRIGAAPAARGSGWRRSAWSTAAPPRRPPPPVHAQSTTQMLPSLSTRMPCGATNMPPPKCATTLPLASNFITGSSVELPQPFAPHRSAIQMLLPSRSIATALVAPHMRPAGSLAHVVSVRYGFGRSLSGGIVGDDACARTIAGASADQREQRKSARE